MRDALDLTTLLEGHTFDFAATPEVVLPVVIAQLPVGLDALEAFAFDEVDGSTTMYFRRFNCVNNRSGIYRITDADTAALRFAGDGGR